jgi:pimeloyl-ACP methyl ester carboxylesterase
LTKPARGSTGVPDRDLHARSLTFDSATGIKLSAWFVPGSSGAGALLLLHSVRSNKRTMLPRARFLSALGFSVLLVDLQAHGESEGERISFGYREAADVRASVAAQELPRVSALAFSASHWAQPPSTVHIHPARCGGAGVSLPDHRGGSGEPTAHPLRCDRSVVVSRTPSPAGSASWC